MKIIIWITPLLLIQSYHAISSNLQDEYNQYSFYQNKPLSPRPLDAMADLTNDLGVCVLRVIAAGGDIGNIAFSPFGLMAVSVLLYEGSSGYSALQIKQSLNLPWEILAVRIGVRDLNRYLKTYFKSDGFLNGLTMSREEVCLRPQFKRVLQLYGFDDPNSFLVDSCPESVKTTMQPLKPMSVTTHGTVLTEMTPTSQVIQISTNITNGSASDISIVSTEFPAKVTYVGDATFSISSVDTNTNVPMMNSQTDTMVVDIETQPHVRPIESSTNRMETTAFVVEQELKSSNEMDVANATNPTNDSVVTEATVRLDIVPKDSTMDTTILPQITQSWNFSSNIANDSYTDTMTDHTTSIIDESYTSPFKETSTAQPYENGGNYDPSNMPITTTVAAFDVFMGTTLPRNSYVTSIKNVSDIIVETASNTSQDANNATITSVDDELDGPSTINNIDIQIGNTVDTIGMTFTTNAVTTDAIDENTKSIEDTVDITRLSTKPVSNDDGTTKMFEETTISEIAVTDQTTLSTMSGRNNNNVTTSSENLMSTTEFLSTTTNLNNVTESEIIKVAESNQRYQIASLPEMKSARSMESNDNLLPTFNVEFVVRKEDLRPDCNKTRKRTIIKPDKILTEYPKNSGISITLRESKKRRRRHLEQYQGYDTTRFNRYKTYGYRPLSAGWTVRSSEPFESANLFNDGYRRIPFFTYTAVLPFGFIFELKSQVIEIPLDDPKYTLMILMPNHSDGLSELLLMLPSMSLRNIHNSLKPTAVHATIPMFKYTAKVDLTSALQQIGIRDVFYRYRADLSFMSPDARLFVSSVQQVVSVTAKKYNTPPVYEIQYKYVKHDFVVSRPFVYFVMDIHTKVSLIAGVITDPLASPIWI